MHPSQRYPIPLLETSISNPTAGESALWRAVITQALMDAASRSHKAEARFAKHEALHWLTSRSADFATVCHFAGLCPDYVRRQAKRALTRGCAWRSEAPRAQRQKTKPPAGRKEQRQEGNEGGNCQVLSFPLQAHG